MIRQDGESDKFERVKISRLDAVERRPVRWLWMHRIAIGKLTLLAGDPGLGKSHISLDIAARVSAGAAWPDGAPSGGAGSVVILSAEDDAADTILPRLDRAGAALSNCYVLSGVERFDFEADDFRPAMFDLNRHIPLLESHIDAIASESLPVRLIVVDPIGAFCGRTDSHKNAEVRAMLAMLADLAARRGIAVLAVTHLTKNAGGRAVYRATGSLAFAAAARAVWMVARDLGDAEKRLMLIVKNNLAPDVGGLSFTIEADAAGGSHVHWGAEPVAMTADEYLVMENEKLSGRPASGRGGDRLLSFIERRGGAVTVRDVQSGCRWLREAGAAEHALNTLAAEGLGEWESLPPTDRGGRPGRTFVLSTKPHCQQNLAKRGENRGFADADSFADAEEETRYLTEEEINSIWFPGDPPRRK